METSPPQGTQGKRIVIIEGDAFDADAIVAIRQSTSLIFVVHINGKEDGVVYKFPDEATRDETMDDAIDAWRTAVGDVLPEIALPAPSDPLPNQPVPEPTYWSDEKGRYFETYGGSPIYRSTITGESLIWNAGPPGRSNVVGPAASPIVKVYVDEAGKPLDPQPI